MVLKSEGHAVGSIGLMIGEASNIGLPDAEGKIGYWIGVPFRGQGLFRRRYGKLSDMPLRTCTLKSCGADTLTVTSNQSEFRKNVDLHIIIQTRTSHGR